MRLLLPIHPSTCPLGHARRTVERAHFKLAAAKRLQAQNPLRDNEKRQTSGSAGTEDLSCSNLNEANKVDLEWQDLSLVLKEGR